MPPPRWRPRDDFQARLAGAFFFLLGLALYGLQARAVFAAVDRGDRQITQFPAAIALGTMAMILGGYWLAGGLRAYAATLALQADRGRLRIFAVLIVGFAFAVVYAVRFWLSTLGYE